MNLNLKYTSRWRYKCTATTDAELRDFPEESLWMFPEARKPVVERKNTILNNSNEKTHQI